VGAACQLVVSWRQHSVSVEFTSFIWRGVVVCLSVGIGQGTSGPGMGNHQWVVKSPSYVTSQPGQLSVTISPWLRWCSEYQPKPSTPCTALAPYPWSHSIICPSEECRKQGWVATGLKVTFLSLKRHKNWDLLTWTSSCIHCESYSTVHVVVAVINFCWGYAVSLCHILC